MSNAAQTLDAARSSRTRGFPLRGLLFLGVAVLVVVLDQFTKRLAEDRLRGERSVPVVDDILRLTYVQNRGAAFGLLQDQTTFFVLVGILVIGVIAMSYRYLPRSGFLLHLALGLMLGGAIGNLIDRVRQGYVVDFVDFGYRANWWPVFNVADSAIVIGVALMALNALSPSSEQQSPASSAGDASG
jgi:signal peptidase II